MCCGQWALWKKVGDRIWAILHSVSGTNIACGFTGFLKSCQKWGRSVDTRKRNPNSWHFVCLAQLKSSLFSFEIVAAYIAFKCEVLTGSWRFWEVCFEEGNAFSFLFSSPSFCPILSNWSEQLQGSISLKDMYGHDTAERWCPVTGQWPLLGLCGELQDQRLPEPTRLIQLPKSIFFFLVKIIIKSTKQNILLEWNASKATGEKGVSGKLFPVTVILNK